MPRGRLDKVDILARVTRMKNDLYNGVYDGASEEWLNGAHYSLNQVLEVINEYSQWQKKN
mgnify:CR=1 FL=1